MFHYFVWVINERELAHQAKGKWAFWVKLFLQMRHVVANSTCWKCVYVIANYPTSFVRQKKFGNHWFNWGLLLNVLGPVILYLYKNCWQKLWPFAPVKLCTHTSEQYLNWRVRYYWMSLWIDSSVVTTNIPKDHSAFRMLITIYQYTWCNPRRLECSATLLWASQS